ncbi:MAG: GNAT family N-acetyltransferase [Candidatus Hodarchaeota archaeon]
MMVELKKKDFEKVKPVIVPVNFHLAISAIIDGVIPGRIWVDNKDTPQTAMIWDTRYSYFLAGNENNEVFNNAFDSIFTKTIAPDALQRGFELFFLICSQNWKKRFLNNELLKDETPLRTIERQYYTLKQPKLIDWKKRIPIDFSMKFVDKKFLETNLENSNPFNDEINDISGSKVEFIRKGNFGFALVYKDNQLTSWCLSFLHGSSCEIWVQTIEEYQQKGFGTLTTAAFVDYCVSNNIKMGWHSNKENIGSTKLAERVGFEKTTDEYSWVYGRFNIN